MRVTQWRQLSVVLFLLVSCGQEGPSGSNATVSGRHSHVSAVVDELESAINASERSIDHHERLTVVVGFGLEIVQDVLVAMRTQDGWRAEYYVFWRRGGADSSKDRPVCLSTAESQTYTICLLAEREEVNPLTAELLGLGALKLLDPKAMNRKQRPFADGVNLLLRASRDDSVHDAYFDNPDQQSYPEAKPATEIVNAMRQFRETVTRREAK